jgi:hypothetical protein
MRIESRGIPCNQDYGSLISHLSQAVLWLDVSLLEHHWMRLFLANAASTAHGPSNFFGRSRMQVVTMHISGPSEHHTPQECSQPSTLGNYSALHGADMEQNHIEFVRQ